jgi:hypothetical protein
MKIIALSTLLILVSLSMGISQTICCPYIGPIEIIPAQPTTADTIRIVTRTTTPDLGQRISYSFTMNADSIHLEGCFFDGPLTVPQNFYDTTTIGPLGIGIYQVDYVGKISSSEVDCIPVDSQMVRASFEVFVLNAVDADDLGENQISISPNPVRDFLSIEAKGASKSLRFSLLNIWGQVCCSGDFTKTSRIDLSQMAEGIYVLSVEGKGVHFAQMILKH